jgi:predicted acylesterase/phospholipase RssA
LEHHVRKQTVADINLAKAYLNGTASLSAADLLALALSLKANARFGWARRVLKQSLDTVAGVDRRHMLEFASCTSLDRDVPAALRFDRALDILERVDSLVSTGDREVLCTAGDIWRRRWDAFGQKADLERALAVYLRASSLETIDQLASEDLANAFAAAKSGVAAALSLDLLAFLDERSFESIGIVLAVAEERRALAQRVRSDMQRGLESVIERPDIDSSDYKWRFQIMLAEVHFGLGRDDAMHYPLAAHVLQAAVGNGQVSDHDQQDAARRLIALAQAQRLEDQMAHASASDEATSADDVLRVLYGPNADLAAACALGKVGLALSGGGHRAALYHIGVLAKLAEMDMLRRVEVLSCVSGGSVIGTHYYLEVRRLLETKPDHQITPDEYVAIVKKVADDYLAGAQRNIRHHIFRSIRINIRMALSGNYHRTHRLGELFEEHLYRCVQDGWGHAPRWLSDLKIQPCDGPEDFHPRDHNWRRNAKAPILVLNAASLNTSHSWQFTATWIGEAQASINRDVDRNYRILRKYFSEEPPYPIRLGHAVAASAAVPGIFDPIAIDRLYRDTSEGVPSEIVVRLTDGGAYDNQGTASLLEQDCDVLLVSDASGQLREQDDPSGSILGVPQRAAGITMARVRTIQHQDLKNRVNSGQLRNLMYVHLRQEIPTRSIGWSTDEVSIDEDQFSNGSAANDTWTSYGVRTDVQSALSMLRTDFDTFHDAEAFALMTSAYCMTEAALHRDFADFIHSDPADDTTWRFLQVRDLLTGPRPPRELLKLLRTGQGRFFKVWQLFPVLFVIPVAILAAAALLLYHWRSHGFHVDITIGEILGSIFLAGIVVIAQRLAGKWLARLIRYRQTLGQLALTLVAAVVGPIAVWVYSVPLNWLYRRAGRLDRLR